MEICTNASLSVTGEEAAKHPLSPHSSSGETRQDGAEEESSICHRMELNSVFSANVI
jgi:hypothetical protein